MAYKKIVMELDKKIALVAHDNKKRDLIEWAKFNRDLLAHHKVYATGTTGLMLEEELVFRSPSCRAARSAATSRSAPRSWMATSIS